MTRSGTIAWILAGGGLCAPLLLVALELPPPVVNPATYESDSGEYVLEVDPSHRHGQGAATYRLTRQGKEVWSGERPFTLLAARLGGDGVVAGYAYSGGLEGFAKDDKLHLLILDPAGAVRLDDATPRRMSRVIDGGPEPNADGLLFDPENDRVVFRVSNVAEPEVWKPYRLSTGEALATLQPSASGATDDVRLSVVDAEPVRGTGLTLVHWWRGDTQRGDLGARFTLVNPSGKPVWTLDLPQDYRAPNGDPGAQERMRSLAWESAILEASRPREFEVRVAATAERVRHEVQQDRKGGWVVREAGRQPWAQTEPTLEGDVAEAGPEKALRYLGAIPLSGGGGGGDAAIRDVHRFDVDDQSRFGFARDDGQCDLVFVIGTIREPPRETKLGRLGQQHCPWPLVAWAGGPDWLVTVEYAKAEDGHAGWWVNVETGATRPFTLPAGVSVGAVAGRPSGGVVLLGERRTPGIWGDESRTLLLWLDARGQEQRTFSEAANRSDSKLLSPDDLAVTTAGEVVVVDVIRHRVAVFDSSGVFRRSIDLEKSWGREPRYPSGIARDVDGGFIVEDFGAAIPFVRMEADGAVRAELRPRYDDGRPTGRLFRVQAGPDGTVWGSDGEALLRLGEDGVVEGAAGVPASTDDLGEVAALALGPGDRIHAADRRTGAVHVFNREGKLQHVCRPDPGDVEDALDSPSLTVTDDGRVYLRPDDGFDREGGFLEFSATGQRLARHAWPDPSRLWNSVTGGFWALRWHELALVDEEGRVTRTIKRRIDRRWLDWISGAVVAPDGSIAVAVDSPRPQASHGEATLNLYAGDGLPIRMIRVAPGESPGRFAYDGRSIALWQEGELRVMDATGRHIARSKPGPAGKPASGWPLLIAAQGGELWMFEPEGKTMHRFELP